MRSLFILRVTSLTSQYGCGFEWQTAVIAVKVILTMANSQHAEANSFVLLTLMGMQMVISLLIVNQWQCKRRWVPFDIIIKKKNNNMKEFCRDFFLPTNYWPNQAFFLFRIEILYHWHLHSICVCDFVIKFFRWKLLNRRPIAMFKNAIVGNLWIENTVFVQLAKYSKSNNRNRKHFIQFISYNGAKNVNSDKSRLKLSVL